MGEKKLWIVCQQSSTQMPSKVKAFAEKEKAVGDCCKRLMAAPANTMFWVESVDFDGDVVIADA